MTRSAIWGRRAGVTVPRLWESWPAGAAYTKSHLQSVAQSSPSDSSRITSCNSGRRVAWWLEHKSTLTLAQCQPDQLLFLVGCTAAAFIEQIVQLLLNSQWQGRGCRHRTCVARCSTKGDPERAKDFRNPRGESASKMTRRGMTASGRFFFTDCLSHGPI
jgi:hypothetical protein